MKHTPGPWKVDKIGFICAKDGWVAVPYSVKSKRSKACRSHEEQLANARLIAAAPVLLEALKYTRATLESSNLPSASLTLLKISKAIALAEGRKNETP